jgi:hypothetical protein
MKTKLMAAIVCLVFFDDPYAQHAPAWDKWDWLIGDWLGEGSGAPGQGGGSFSFKLDLDKRILVRKSHSEYPAADGKPPLVHEDLLIVYPDPSGIADQAIYFDNEGHVIQYTLAYADKAIVFTSDKIPGAPVFRLTYARLDDGTVNTEFAMSRDGEKFTPYVAGRSRKVK